MFNSDTSEEGRLTQRLIHENLLPQAEAMAKVEAWSRSHRDWGWRIYRTRAGLRLLLEKHGGYEVVGEAGCSADALDRAAVAGISASNPFPALPPEYKGDVIRLQFNFAYNIPNR
jgi:hypothetical protein